MAPHCFIVSPSNPDGASPDGSFNVLFRAYYKEFLELFGYEYTLRDNVLFVSSMIEYQKGEISTVFGTLKIEETPDTLIFHEYIKVTYRVDYIGDGVAMMEDFRNNPQNYFKLGDFFFDGFEDFQVGF